MASVIFCPLCGCAAEALVLIDFEGTMSDELTVRTGDVLKNVTKAGEEGWLEGEVNGKRGIFPSNFVKVGEQTYGCSPWLKLKQGTFRLLITGDPRLFNGGRQEGTEKH